MNFKEIYDKSIANKEKRYIESSNFSSKPIMIGDIITPESAICIQPIYDIEFELDRDGMSKVIEMLENRWNSKPESEKSNLMSILSDIYTITEEYLGGHGVGNVRKNAYLETSDGHLNLSNIQGKKIGLCAERAAIGHQLFSLLGKAGLTNFDSFFTNSFITTSESKIPHSFILLKHRTDLSKQYIFDIENLLKYKPREDIEPILGIGLYPITQEEFEQFKDGKSIAPKSIYEQFGMPIVSSKRFYGNEDIAIISKKENIANEEKDRDD